jgi:DNA-3-methyladenine glycosylase
MNKDFFMNTEDVAKKLLGMKLVHETPEGKIAGKIVEVEAYLFDDPASHSYRGKTQRNEAMFEEGGVAYVYKIYGVHHCFNVVTNKKEIGEAVLIRALEPLEGIELMKKNRNKDFDLCNGPAKLVVALGITKEHNKMNLSSGSLRLEEFEAPKKIIAKKRIGISEGKNLKLRFYIQGNKFVSRK